MVRVVFTLKKSTPRSGALNKVAFLRSQDPAYSCQGLHTAARGFILKGVFYAVPAFS